MRFRIVWLLPLALLLGCAKNSQNPEDGLSYHLSAGDTDCVSGMGTKVQGFFSAVGSASDIHSVWTCATKVLGDFSQYTEGARPDGYTGAELKGFLNKYYFTTALSDDAINSTLVFKQAVVGGTSDFVTRGEIQTLMQVIGVLDATTQSIFPVAKLLFTDSDLAAIDSDFLNAHAVMADAVDRISLVLAHSGHEYAFADFRKFLQSWGTQLNLPPDHLLMKVANLVPALGTGKAVLIAGSAASVQPDEWQPLLSTLARGYSYYRMLSRITAPEDKMAFLAHARLPWLVDGVIGLLDRGVGRRVDKQIKLSEIHDFLIGLQSQGFFSKSFTADQAVTTAQFLLNKIFATPGAPVDTLTANTVSEMRRFLNGWNLYDAALVSRNFSSVAEFGAAVRPSGVSMSLDSMGRLEFPGGHVGVFHEFSATFAVLEWLGQKWGTWPLSQAVLDNTVSDCLTVFHALNLLMGTDATFSKKLMRDANLFVLSSNGDLIFDKAEAFQYAVYALSGYRGSHALDLATASCAGNAACVPPLWFQNRQTLLANFPNLLGWLNNSSATWTTYSQDIGKVVGADQWLEQFVVIHYIETYMQRFDQGHDQFINLSDSMTAFPIFHPMLSILLPQNGLAESDVEPMYTFLLKYGAIPTSMSGGAFTYFLWKNSPSSWSYSSDRNIIAGILASLGSF